MLIRPPDVNINSIHLRGWINSQCFFKCIFCNSIDISRWHFDSLAKYVPWWGLIHFLIHITQLIHEWNRKDMHLHIFLKLNCLECKYDVNGNVKPGSHSLFTIYHLLIIFILFNHFESKLISESESFCSLPFHIFSQTDLRFSC